MREIANTLTEESIPTPGGQKMWQVSTIRRILSSEIYRGNYIYQRFHSGFSLMLFSTLYALFLIFIRQIKRRY